MNNEWPLDTDTFVIDVNQMTEQIWHDLDGVVDREVVHRSVLNATAQFRSATVLTYVPIFVRQKVLKELTLLGWLRRSSLPGN